MGCAALRSPKTGASKGQSATEERVSNPPVVTTTLVTEFVPAAASAPAQKSPNASPKATAQKKDANLVMQDADDEDDIEIIYETNPKQHEQKQPHASYERLNQLMQQESQICDAANGQEPPEAVEADSRLKKAEKPQEPLSKSQQEEAAKLAERRKKFDNQRYHTDITPYQHNEMMQGPTSDNGMRKPVSTAAPDMVFGLNQAQVKDPQSQPSNCFMDLPGGILDDLEPVHMASGKKKLQTHDDLEMTDLDADDERLMAELMDELEL